MLMYIFNQEVFWYIKVFTSILAGVLTVGGAVRAFSSDQFFKDFRVKDGRSRIYQGFFLIIIGLLLCYFWIFFREQGLFKHFEDETYGTPTFLVNQRIKDKEISKIKTDEIKQQVLEKEKIKAEKKRQKTE